MHYNRILDDPARDLYEPVIRELSAVVPEIVARKIPRALVQQAFMLDTLRRLGKVGARVLAIGAFEDVTCDLLLRTERDQAQFAEVVAIDERWGCDLATFFHSWDGKLFDLVYATSVLEHVPDDRTFCDQMAALVAPEGFALLTVDFHPQGGPGIPGVYRLYTPAQLTDLVSGAFSGFDLVDAPHWEPATLDFENFNIFYTFATVVLQRRKESCEK